MQEGAGQKLAAAAAGQEAVDSFTEINAPATGTRAGASVAISGLDFPRYFSTAGVDPFDQVEWELRDAVIGSERGKVVFEQLGVEMPKAWSQQATNIVVSKYFRGHVGSPEREFSVKQLIGRVVGVINRRAAKLAIDAAVTIAQRIVAVALEQRVAGVVAPHFGEAI